MRLINVLLALTLLVGCGRIHFDAVPGDTAVARDGSLDLGLLAHYKLDDVPSDGVEDSIGTNPGACAPCPLQAPGVIGGAFVFDTSAPVIQVMHAPAFAQAAGTVSVWVRPRVGGQDACVAQKVFGAAVDNSWQICSTSDDHLVVCSKPPGSLLCSTSPTPVFRAGIWQHVAMTWDGARHAGWMDGVQLVEAVTTTMIDGGPIVIGADLNAGVPDLAFDGLIDDVRIYDRVLTVDELGSLATQ